MSIQRSLVVDKLSARKIHFGELDGPDHVRIASELQVDTINESTGGAGVTIEGVEIRDDDIRVNTLRPIEGGPSLITVLGDDVVLDSGTHLTVTGEILADEIYERTTNQGVAIDGVLVKDTSISFDGGTNALSTYVGQTSWTPTLTIVGNLSSATLNNAYYSRIGSVVFFKVDTVVNVSAAAARAQFNMTLPVPIGAGQDTHSTCNGYANVSTEDVPALGRIIDDVGTSFDRIAVTFTTAVTTGVGSCSISGWYWA